MNDSHSRRTMLKWMGIQLALPLASHLFPRPAHGQPAPRQNFVAVYFPNGAHMPTGENGSWTFDDALAPLGAYRDRTMVMRGLYNGFNGIDPHWQNCAGFLSCHPIELGDPGVARCAKSLDQYVADARPSTLRSLEIGGLYYHQHLLNDHPGYSHDYLNRISWQAADKFRTPVANPVRLFEQLFTDGSVKSAAYLEYLRKRRMSVLDHLHGDATRLSSRLPSEYGPVLESYMQTVRELEQQIGTPLQSCPGAPLTPMGNFDDANANYVRRFELMHEMLAVALGCGLIHVASIMYGPAVSDGLDFSESIGPGAGHHTCAHHGGDAARIERLKQMNRLQVGLLANLLKRLDERALLDDTLVLYGSDMSDGDKHHPENLPVLLCGGRSDLKLGQEIGSKDQRRPLSDLHMDILGLMGVKSKTSFGSGECMSTGASLGLLR